MKTKKYTLTDEAMTHLNRTIHRIKALKDFGDVKAGDLGGWIEKEENLSQEGTCWVYDEAKVYDDAHVCAHAKITDRALIAHDAFVCGWAIVSQDAAVINRAMVDMNAKIYGKSRICEGAICSGNCEVFEFPKIAGCTVISGNAKIHGYATIYGSVSVCDNTEVFDNACIYDSVHLIKDAKVHGDTILRGKTIVFKELTRTRDCISIGPVGSRNDHVTFVKKGRYIYVATGCFTGTLGEFRRAVKRKHQSNYYAKQYELAINAAVEMLNLPE